MKVRYIHLTGASGSIGGTTAARNRGGNYMRSRVSPVNPNTVFQSIARNISAGLATAWRDELTAAERTGWDDYAGTISRNDPLGQEINLTGLNMYAAGNSRLQLCGGTRVDTPPTLPGTAFLPFTPDSWHLYDDGTFEIGGVNGGDWAAAAGGRLMVYASAPMGPARNFRPACRFVGSLEFLLTPIPEPAVVTLDAERLGATLAVGQRRYVRFTSVDAQARTGVIFNIGPMTVEAAP